MQTWRLYAHYVKMTVKMAAEKFGLTTIVTLLTVFVIL